MCGKLPVVSRELEHKYIAWSTENGYNTSKPQSWLTNVDVNSLYPWGMIQFLPNGETREVELSRVCEERVAMLKKRVDSYSPNCAYLSKQEF